MSTLTNAPQPTPTKITRTTTTVLPNPFLGLTEPGALTETVETEAKCSVTLKEDAKGSVRVDEYKVYHNDPSEAERLALEGMMRLRARIAQAAESRLQQQLAESAGIVGKP